MYQARVATIQGRSLNLYRVPKWQDLYGTYVSDVTGKLHQITRTYSSTLIPLHIFITTVKMKLEALEVDL